MHSADHRFRRIVRVFAAYVKSLGDFMNCSEPQ
jgi:hypothetical protein